jgi:multidrug transporter EmrE-like cation transporter
MNLYWLMLLSAIAASMVGQTLLKTGAGASSFVAQMLDPRSVAGLGLYGGAALLYMFSLRRIPMSVALPCTAISYVAAAAIGHYMFGETMTWPHIAALALICSGVAMLALA